MGVSEVLVRVAIGFIVLLALARMMGRKEISQMTFFNFVSALALGSMGGTFVVSKDISIKNGIIAFIGWSIFTLLTDVLVIKSKGARKAFVGDPIIVIKEGKIIESALKKCRLSLDSLSAMLREKNVFAIADVDYAILETNGQLAVLKKESKQTLTKKDMHIQGIKQNVHPIATKVISDGAVVTNNLSKLNLNHKWLEDQLQQAGVTSVSDVFYAEVQQDGTLFIDSKDNLLQ